MHSHIFYTAAVSGLAAGRAVGWPCSQVGSHGWRENRFGRRVIGLDTCYFILSRRYLCHACQKQAEVQRNVVEAAAAHAGLRVVSDQPTVVPHTFMRWDPKSVERLPNDHGELFPAFLTWRGAPDKCVIDFMRPLFAAGLRPEVNCCVCVILVFSLPLNSWYSITEETMSQLLSFHHCPFSLCPARGIRRLRQDDVGT